MSGRRVIAVGSPPMFRQEVARALGAQPEAVGWVPSVSEAQEYVAGNGDRADVLILSPRVDERAALELARIASRAAPATALVLVREEEVNGLLPVAVRAGIRDVVDLSQGPEEMREALERAIRWSASLHRDGRASFDGKAPRGMLISVFSSKGGTGKTFLAANLAASVAELTGRDTAVVDLSPRLGDVFVYYGAEPPGPLQDFTEPGATDRENVLAAGTRLRDNLWGFGPPGEPGSETVAPGAVGTALEALRGTFDFTVVDATAEYSEAALAALDISDVICLVASLDVVAVRHLARALETLMSAGVPRERLRIVLNRADSEVGLNLRELERVLKLKIDAAIPSSRLVPLSLNDGHPVCLSHPRSEVARGVRSLAERLVSTAGVPAEAPEPDGRKRHLLRRR